jgi:aminoglycoside/choline kinase family phosphotransferase
LSSERDDLKAAFLAEHGLADARRQPLAGDASTRLYERLHKPDGSSLIFMDQPPSVETQPCPPQASEAERIALGYNARARLAAGRVEAFIACAGFLRDQGLSAPGIIAADAPNGLCVLEDLGDDLYASLIAGGADETPLYDGAIDALVQLHQTTPPDILTGGGPSGSKMAWPLLTYDDLALRTGGEMFLEWWPKFSGRAPFSDDACAEWEALWAPIRKRGVEGATVFCHRDYHAENLIWLPNRVGVARVGLLDFQDALRAHPVWDLSMLLHDGRRDVSAEREAACLARYLAARPEVDRETLLADYHGLGALNCARILFIFARQVAGFGRPKYQAFMPRMWTYLDRCFADPSLKAVKAWFDREIPPETRA